MTDDPEQQQPEVVNRLLSMDPEIITMHDCRVAAETIKSLQQQLERKTSVIENYRLECTKLHKRVADGLNALLQQAKTKGTTDLVPGAAYEAVCNEAEALQQQLTQVTRRRKPMAEPDLFGETPKTYNTLAYPAPPGSGPEGETCGTCNHCYSRSFSKRVYKCGLMSGSHSDRTDIGVRKKACAFHTPQQTR